MAIASPPVDMVDRNQAQVTCFILARKPTLPGEALCCSFCSMVVLCRPCLLLVSGDDIIGEYDLRRVQDVFRLTACFFGNTLDRSCDKPVLYALAHMTDQEKRL